MKRIYKKISAVILGLFNVALGFFIFLQLLNLVDVRLLKAGYLEGAGGGQFFRVYIGIPLLLLLSFSWLGLVIFSFNYYIKGAKTGNLTKRFSIITSIEFYILPLIIIIYQMAFPMPMLTIDWVVIVGGSLIGSIFMYLYYKQK
ncbi:MAG: hypothetical protein ACOCRB_00420 [Halanaerobiaceae bacterium]